MAARREQARTSRLLMKLTLIQANPIVGDIEGNKQRLLGWLEEYGTESDLLVVPELYLTGYPPRDLLLKANLLEAVDQAVETLLQASRRQATGLLFGAPRQRQRTYGHGLGNAALLIADGRIVQEQDKVLLPTYDVFDESRYFDAGELPEPVSFCGHKLGICICEDAWLMPSVRTERLYASNPVAKLVEAGAEVIINLSASPFHKGKERLRQQIGWQQVEKHGVAFILVNQVGANDELIFDGRSFAISGDGQLMADLAGFEEDIVTINLSAPQKTKFPAEAAASASSIHQKAFALHTETDDVRRALVLGVKDYFRKVNVRKALIGLSGGIDSALVACIAAEALGADQVYGVTLPGPYSSAGSQADSQLLAERLGIHFDALSITATFKQMLDALAPLFGDKPIDLTEENMQARIRGHLLMALSNKFGHLLLCTSNKSEIAVGYATLYGDATGALAVIGDLLKGQVYELAQAYNDHETDDARKLIPQAILDKAPSAELRPNQKDSDSLPPYEVLDAIIHLYVESAFTADTIIEAGYGEAVVKEVIRLINQSEYKRRQLPPVLRISHKSFGTGRRLPVAARF